MGLFNTVKRILGNAAKEGENRKKSSVKPKGRNNGLLRRVYKPNYKIKQPISVTLSETVEWKNFFSITKNNPLLPGFENRSRRKFNLLHKGKDCIVVSAAKEITLIQEKGTYNIDLKDSPLEKMTIFKANKNGAILVQKENVAFVSFAKAKAYIYEFKWQPFTFELSDSHWLVGTRETYEGPGELYCFDFNGNETWGLTFVEKMQSLFGEIKFTPYHIEFSTLGDYILVSSMDKLYKIDKEGRLISRIAISEVKEAELKEKHEEAIRDINSARTEEEFKEIYVQQLVQQLTANFERMTLNSPLSGFTHEPTTEMMFILEEQGRVSAWDKDGRLQWLKAFNKSGRFIKWINNRLVVSLETGETFWLDKTGRITNGIGLPKQAETVSLIEEQNKYLIVAMDNRLYEFNPEENKLVTGSEGYPGMELFKFLSHNTFFDGHKGKQGYLWLAPLGHSWELYIPSKVASSEGTDTLSSEVAPEMSETTKFPQIWTYGDREGRHLVEVAYDFERERIYIVEKVEKDFYDLLNRYPDNEKDREREKHEHLIKCLDFHLNEIWETRVYIPHIWELVLAPDGKTFFISEPIKEAISYLPGNLLAYSDEGKLVGKFKIPAQGFHIDFSSENEGVVTFATDKGETPIKQKITKNQAGKWTLDKKVELLEDKKGEYGAGMYNGETKNFSFKRSEKKKYHVKSEENESEIKVNGAIYEYGETPSNLLMVRTGNKSVMFFDGSLNKVNELKTETNIVNIVLGDDTFIINTKNEFIGYSYEFNLKYRFSPSPKAYINEVKWLEGDKSYLWGVGNSSKLVIAKIMETGEIKYSEEFEEIISAVPFVHNKDRFFVRFNGKIKSYSLK
ncbi:ornithine cyclodeaminase [Thalassorhabdus alkalitolerans]|uniref:Ornithine cyclodeaminase n=1 Tax=Thalassorhabdus alkalitolerans TaxID=2282697 RepID=A0ABW0YRC0_9BACI